jgi:tetratricopeptide (TPR) repeat protein
MRVGELVDAARNGDWKRLPEMAAYIRGADADVVMAASLIRILVDCPDEAKWPVIRESLKHASPLVRGAAARTLGSGMSPENAAPLYDALSDEYRVVRVYAASALSRMSRDSIPQVHREAYVAAEKELLQSFDLNPDRWHGHYNRGNYLTDQGDLEGALAAYEIAIKRRGDIIPPYVNASMVASRLGNIHRAVTFLKTAHEIDAKEGSVNFNLGLALAETGDLAGAQKHLELAMNHGNNKAQAAFNLAVIKGRTDPAEAARLCRVAVDEDRGNARYRYTRAYYLEQSDDVPLAIEVLEALLKEHPEYQDARALLEHCRKRLK